MTTDMEEAIFDMIAEKGDVSFAELSRLEGFQGDYCIERDENAVLGWHL